MLLLFIGDLKQKPPPRTHEDGGPTIPSPPEKLLFWTLALAIPLYYTRKRMATQGVYAAESSIRRNGGVCRLLRQGVRPLFL